MYDAAARARRAIEPAKRADAGAAHGYPQRVRAGPGARAALLRLPPARRQDPGRRARRGRLPAHPADPLARGGADRPRDGRGARLRPGRRRRRRPSARPRPSARSGTTARTPWTSWLVPIGGFEANAQTLRILTRLEAKVIEPGRELSGTEPHPGDVGCGHQVPVAAARRAHASSGSTPKTGPPSTGSGPERRIDRRCLEAQVMDWADDVAYSVHDVEDGVYGGHIRLAEVDDHGPRPAGRGRPGAVHGPAGQQARAGAGATARVADARRSRRLRRLVRRPGGRQAGDQRADRPIRGCGRPRDPGAIRRPAAVPVRGRPGDSRTRSRPSARCSRRWRRTTSCADRAPTSGWPASGGRCTSWRRRSYESAPDGLGSVARAAWTAAVDDAGRLRAVVDQVAQLTDSAAVAWHAALCGRPDVSAHA